ncbi:MAG: S1 family peptidase [Holophagales bacterium]|nr:S1 family peptidase [Holophagales bacterium]
MLSAPQRSSTMAQPRWTGPARLGLVAARLLVPLSVSSAAEGDRAAGHRTWAMEDLAAERNAQVRHEADLLARSGVRGVGIGLDDDGEPALLVMADGTASRASLPASLDGVPVKVEEMVGGGLINGGHGGGVFPVGCHDGLFAKPIPMGTSTSSILACDAGTLGFKACDATHGYAGYVTAMHVATLDADFCEGEAPIGTQQVHRGKLETSPTCNSSFVIGGLDRFVPISATGNLVDAAFVRSNDNRTPPAVLDAHTISSVGTPALGICVAKSGRTTGYTPAKIDAVNVTWSDDELCLGTGIENQTAQFIGLFRFGYDGGSCGTCTDPDCWEVALGGDSGSAVFSRLLEGRLYGRLFGNVGFRNTNALDGVEVRGIAAPAQTVLDELDLTLCH